MFIQSVQCSYVLYVFCLIGFEFKIVEGVSTAGVEMKILYRKWFKCSNIVRVLTHVSLNFGLH